jgi:hypothetical protein
MKTNTAKWNPLGTTIWCSVINISDTFWRVLRIGPAKNGQ